MPSWWNQNYRFRKQLTITAPAADNVPAGYPIKLTEDTAALETAGKLLANRNDWRVVYWNGSSWIDLPRHYIGTTHTVFGTQAIITATNTDIDHYIYYNYASEGSNQDPTTDADWNGIYIPPSTGGSIYGLWHCKEGAGATVEDTSAARNMSFGGSTAWATTGKFGYSINFPNASGGYMQSSSFSFDRFTFQCFAKGTDAGELMRATSPTLKVLITVVSGGRITIGAWGETGSNSATTAAAVLSNSEGRHIAIAFDGSRYFDIYKNGILQEALDLSGGGQVLLRVGASTIRCGDEWDGQMSNIKMTSLNTTSYPHAFLAAVTVSQGDEEIPPAGFLIIL